MGIRARERQQGKRTGLVLSTAGNFLGLSFSLSGLELEFFLFFLFGKSTGRDGKVQALDRLRPNAHNLLGLDFLWGAGFFFFLFSESTYVRIRAV